MAFKIYTKTGDKGETSLIGGTRVPKHHIRIEAYGTVDELNSYIGLIRDLISESHNQYKLLLEIQDRLFTLGSHLATDPAKMGKKVLPDLLETDVLLLENEMDAMDAELPELRHFVLPGGHQSVSFCHLARTVCRRAERAVVLLGELETLNDTPRQYLNRLSDLMFVLARVLNRQNGGDDVYWKSERLARELQK